MIRLFKYLDEKYKFKNNTLHTKMYILTIIKLLLQILILFAIMRTQVD